MLERPDTDTDAVRLTFPAGNSKADLNAMVLAGSAEALGLEPAQAAGLRVALAAESTGTLSRHGAGEPCEVSIELDYEPDGRKISLTAAERTSTNSSCENGGPVWSDPAAVEPVEEFRAEFAGSTFVPSILPRVFARVALEAEATFGAVTRCTVLGDLLAAAVTPDSRTDFAVRVHGRNDSLEVAIRSSSDRVLRAMAAAWPAVAEEHGVEPGATLTLRTVLPAQ
jgi:hypothetical protein